MWPSLISKAKFGGLDVIESYVFWNLHEPQPGQVSYPSMNCMYHILSAWIIISCFTIQYDFSGRLDIVRFIKEIQAQGRYACIRIGPFIESEWTYG